MLREDDKYGFSPRAVIDIHKMLACTHILASKDLTDDILEGFKEVIGMSQSAAPKINLMFRSNARLRTGG